MTKMVEIKSVKGNKDFSDAHEAASWLAEMQPAWSSVVLPDGTEEAINWEGQSSDDDEVEAIEDALRALLDPFCDADGSLVETCPRCHRESDDDEDGGRYQHGDDCECGGGCDRCHEARLMACECGSRDVVRSVPGASAGSTVAIPPTCRACLDLAAADHAADCAAE